MSHSRAILSQDIWDVDKDAQEPASQKAIALHYERAQSMCRHAGEQRDCGNGPCLLMNSSTALSLGDIQHLSQKFWNFHFDRELETTSLKIRNSILRISSHCRPGHDGVHHRNHSRESLCRDA